MWVFMPRRDAVVHTKFMMRAAALIPQIALHPPVRLHNGDSLFGAVIFYFTFFTIRASLVLGLIYASELWPRT